MQVRVLERSTPCRNRERRNRERLGLNDVADDFVLVRVLGL